MWDKWIEFSVRPWDILMWQWCWISCHCRSVTRFLSFQIKYCIEAAILLNQLRTHPGPLSFFKAFRPRQHLFNYGSGKETLANLLRWQKGEEEDRRLRDTGWERDSVAKEILQHARDFSSRSRIKLGPSLEAYLFCDRYYIWLCSYSLWVIYSFSTGKKYIYSTSRSMGHD